ncbi:MAG: Ca-activated chloride channel [Chloroflexota bacterium]|jgi:Ca-activated chloride channel family protein|nr:Ca-activated chloride channel [Chloroflexota bacterium]
MSRYSILVLLAVVMVACSGAAYPTSGPNDPNHWRPTPPPWPAPTAAPWWPTAAPQVAPTTPPDFANPGVNPFEDPNQDRYSTFAMDVDTASYSVTRSFLDDGNMPDPNSVRVEEFVNAFDYDYAAPTDSAFAIHLDGGHTPFISTNSILLRVGIKAREIPASQRPSVSMTFVIDTSGSMAGDKLDLVKHALELLVSRLRGDDTIAIVQFSDNATVVLNPISAAESWLINDAINSLQSTNSTNVQAGLELGYDIATIGHREGANDRVVLASDGVANVGLTDADSMLERIDHEVSSGVDLVTVGVGMGDFNDALLEQLADRGNGFYAYVNDRVDAEGVFGDQLAGTLTTVARDAKVQVEFRPEAVSRYRLLGYENRQIADEDFRDPYVDAGEVGAGHSVTALYEIEPAWSSDGFLGTVRLRWIDPATGNEDSAVEDIDLNQLGSEFFDCGPSFRLAAIVAAFAESLLDSPFASGYTLEDVAHEADAISGSFPGSQDVTILRDLTSEAAQLGKGGGW